MVEWIWVLINFIILFSIPVAIIVWLYKLTKRVNQMELAIKELRKSKREQSIDNENK